MWPTGATARTAAGTGTGPRENGVRLLAQGQREGREVEGLTGIAAHSGSVGHWEAVAQR